MRIVGMITTAVMLITLGYGFGSGDFGREGREILDLAWGRVTLIDIYTGVFVFVSWIVWRERSIARAAPWIGALVVLGNFGIGLYLLWISRSAATTEGALLGDRGLFDTPD